MASRLRLAIMIANHRRHHRAISALQTWNVSVKRKILAMLVVTAMADHVADVMEQRRGLKQYARFRGHVMHRLQFIKQQDAQLADVLSMTLVILQPPCKAARTHQ